MSNYAKRLAIDAGGTPMQEYPSPFPATATYNTENGVASSIITINPNSTQIEVGAVGGQGVKIRWIPKTETATVSPFGSVISSGLTANFDHFIPTGTYRRFVVPKETQGAQAGQIGSIAGLYQRVALINAGSGASSVIASEF